MNPADVQTVIVEAMGGLGAAAVFVLALFIGFCVLVGLPKLRPSAGSSLVVRSLDERVGQPVVYLPPTSPRGPVDQLQTPELIEAASRKTA
jgi:hypothetical protein